MKKLTNEEIATVFAMYLYCNFRYRYIDYEPGVWATGAKLLPERLVRVLNDKSVDGIELLLTPLSKITDEHAIKLSELINDIFTREKKWKKGELEQLDEEALQYRAILSKTREKFNEAYQEHLTKQEEFWQSLYTGLPTFQDKVQKILKEFIPITEGIKQIDVQLQGVSKYRLDDMLQIVRIIENLKPEQLAMFNMLVENFKTPQHG